MNPLINSMSRFSGPSGLGGLGNVLSLLKSKNPNEVALSLAQSNPQFKAFYEANKNKSVEEICRENNVDINLVRNLLG